MDPLIEQLLAKGTLCGPYRRTHPFTRLRYWRWLIRRALRRPMPLI